MKLDQKRLAARVVRARAAVAAGRRIRYALGHGGWDPEERLPSTDGLCDCSGFVAWCLWLGRDQRRKWGVWLSTSEIHRDAVGLQRLFARLDQPVPGCLVVYPDSSQAGRLRHGHIGIVTQAKPLRGIDCSASADGIRERPFAFFLRRRPIFCVLREDDAPAPSTPGDNEPCST